MTCGGDGERERRTDLGPAPMPPAPTRSQELPKQDKAVQVSCGDDRIECNKSAYCTDFVLPVVSSFLTSQTLSSARVDDYADDTHTKVVRRSDEREGMAEEMAQQSQALLQETREDRASSGSLRPSHLPTEALNGDRAYAALLDLSKLRTEHLGDVQYLGYHLMVAVVADSEYSRVLQIQKELPNDTCRVCG